MITFAFDCELDNDNYIAAGTKVEVYHYPITHEGFTWIIYNGQPYEFSNNAFVECTQNETIDAQPNTEEEKAMEIMEEYYVQVTHLRYGQEFTEKMTVEAYNVDGIPFELEMLGYDVLSLTLIEETTKDIEVQETLETAKELDVSPHQTYIVGFTFEHNDKDYHATTKVVCANPQKVLYELEKKGYNVCEIHFIEEIGE